MVVILGGNPEDRDGRNPRLFESGRKFDDRERL